MCGIAGVRKFGETPITGEELVLMLCSLEHRGPHATGLALQGPKGVNVLKAAEPAWKFTKGEEFKAFIKKYLTPLTEVALLHTRFATTGSPQENENNHPMFDGKTAVVHNGMISNHDSIFNSEKMTRSCETDSDVLRALIDKYGINEKGLRELDRLTGSAAIASVSEKYPGKLLIARSGSPLTYGFTESQDKLYFASEAQAIHKASRPFYEVRGVWVQDTRSNISVGSMPDNTAWIFGPESIELHHKFTTCAFYNAPNYGNTRADFHRKTSAWRREQKYKKNKGESHILALPAQSVVDDSLKGAVIECSACGCVNRNTKGRAWEQLVCHDCSAKLG